MILLVALVVVLILVYFVWRGRSIYFTNASQPIPSADLHTAISLRIKYPHIMKRAAPERVQDVYALWNNGCINDAQAKLFLGGTRVVPVAQKRGNTNAAAVRGFGYRLDPVGVLDDKDVDSMTKFIETVYGEPATSTTTQYLIVNSDAELPKYTCYFSMYE